MLAAAQQRDPHAFADIVKLHEDRLRLLAYRLLDDRDRTDDVLQEAFIKAFRALPNFKGDSSLATWLYRITYNACIDELRRGRTAAPVATSAEGDEGPSSRPDPAEVAMERRDLAHALAGLTPELRAVVLLVDADDLDYVEAATILNVRPGTIGSRLNRARAALRKALEAEP